MNVGPPRLPPPWVSDDSTRSGAQMMLPATRIDPKMSKMAGTIAIASSHMPRAATLHQRITADPNTAANRPALSPLGGNLAEIRAILAQREPWYRQVMTAELEVTNLSVEEAVVYIVRLL